MGGNFFLDALPVRVVNAVEPFPQPILYFVFQKTQHGFPTRREIHRAGHKVPIPKTVIGAPSGQRIALLAFSQCFLRLFMGQLRADSRQGHREVDGLGQIIVCSHVQSFDDVVALIFCRDHNDRQLNRRIGFAQGLQGVQACHVRHFDIQQYQVNAVLFDSRQQFPRAVCEPDNIAFAGQPAG